MRVSTPAPASLGGKTVLIVGFSNSAVDTATTLAGHAKHVYIARRHDAFVLPRIVDGKPLDHGFNHRKALVLRAAKACLPAVASDAMMRRVLTATHLKGMHGVAAATASQQLPLPSAVALDLAAAPLPNRTPPVISDSIFHEVLAGRVELVRALQRIDGPRAVLLHDGRRIDDIDAIVFCTGYQAEYSLAGEHDPTREQPPGGPPPRAPTAAACPVSTATSSRSTCRTASPSWAASPSPARPSSSTTWRPWPSRASGPARPRRCPPRRHARQRARPAGAARAPR
ncbi:hypothetical protein ACCO45_014010 [Purpureocillium lilacinum]|uniref:Uncharacterized protein n=1 Tax=Purpureocillium lilacinum TaxID=33203 RepID=A0ACC4D8I9_PURLI